MKEQNDQVIMCEERVWDIQRIDGKPTCVGDRPCKMRATYLAYGLFLCTTHKRMADNAITRQEDDPR